MERRLRRERASLRTDAVDAQDEQRVEIHRLDTAYYADLYLGLVMGIAGTTVGLIIGWGFRMATVGLDIALSLIGIALASAVLSVVRLVQEMLLSRGRSRS